ncbi:MAG: polyprenyl synthetase family protein [Deltaproteobacteria bacterium]|nr:polyprenyl synthetase family protein [Deltaproteobacteria bacterium]
MDAATAVQADGAQVLRMLRGAVAQRGLGQLADKLAEAERYAASDLAACAEDFARVRVDEAGPVGPSANHLVSLGGKRLRPLCVALSARTGSGFGAAGRHVAVAAEFVHSATLLHDDVVDVGDSRRGAPTARVVYGNAASIFAGDWLLVAALRHVRMAGLPGLFDSLLGTLEAMIGAESLQLHSRGNLAADRATYLRIADGKTASLFAWCCAGGARAGGADDAQAAALGAYGQKLGLAFQLVDDVLDYGGRPEETGKALFTDLREGKPTFPLLVALERRPQLVRLLEPLLHGEDVPGLHADVATQVVESGALEETRRFAAEQAEGAIAQLSILNDSAARTALETLAYAVVHRFA